MARISPLAILPPVIFAGLAVMFYISMHHDQETLPSMMVGKEAPPVVLTQLGDGQPFTDATLRDGKVKLVNYWASWCAPCRVEAPTLDKIAASGVSIYGVNYKDKAQDALGFLAKVGDPYKALGADTQGQMALNWGVYGVPETYVIDGAGKVLLRFPGPVTNSIWQNTIKPALARAAADDAAKTPTN
ncbi:DsbE family thiol:disulfide interchange protein [Acidimangrovimonas sediminis]|uniref:DsbE family thiol:disulfide interchange protein n=1 Tax=Acidimangrovimonas sediminis TaxID=2056283 RepID=UPI000C809B90|nr:DsbE family thiol:disulfide interchange protein [Acidimangrovimonas sediminis]